MEKGFIAMLVIACVIVLFGLSKACADVTGISATEAQNGARKWARDMGLTVKGVSCAKLDSDNDGYVSCSVSFVKEDGTIGMVPIECAGAITINEGCRVAKVVQPGRGF